ncbi:MAG TPA: COX aromatic rich motif-containing protein [Candidatus Saccharimonadales bacterium]|nr:COX aromatic rich motif-containing protein [Candidatus Saccharimonadales bacterium]
MTKNKKKTSISSIVGRIILGLSALTLLITILLHGNNIALIHTKGLIAHEQLNLMYLTVGIMLILAIPALFLVYFIAWKYRESNTKAAHEPNARYGRRLDVAVWSVPVLFAIVLACIMWPATHRLDPTKTVAADAKPLTIQVVSLRWKWLFIYPDQHIATVNFVQIPVDTPVTFELTADEAPMSSFWIPNLGGMLYTMTGHENRLNLIADMPGDYTGSSGEINGAGFAGMKFTARASSQVAFDEWVDSVKESPDRLGAVQYEALVQPSENNQPAFYSDYVDNLYDKVLMKYMAPGDESMDHGAHH